MTVRTLVHTASDRPRAAPLASTSQRAVRACRCTVHIRRRAPSRTGTRRRACAARSSTGPRVPTPPLRSPAPRGHSSVESPTHRHRPSRRLPARASPHGAAAARRCWLRCPRAGRFGGSAGRPDGADPSRRPTRDRWRRADRDGPHATRARAVIWLVVSTCRSCPNRSPWWRPASPPLRGGRTRAPRRRHPCRAHRQRQREGRAAAPPGTSATITPTGEQEPVARRRAAQERHPEEHDTRSDRATRR